MMGVIKLKTKEMVRRVLPLQIRKHFSILINRQLWLGDSFRYWWTRELLRDFAEDDRSGYHRFLWSHHLAYAASYEIESRYGDENMKESRRMFFSELKDCLQAMGVDPRRDIRSVLEVGCSLGYQLRYLETSLFTGAETLEGIDIDGSAISRGAEYLQKQGSRIRLICDDMGNLCRTLEGKIYDVILCTGVLMYLEDTEAARVVGEMLRHSRVLVAMSGPACPDADNRHLEHAAIRGFDGSFIHNIDSMVERSGGTVYARRWEGNRIVDGNTIYFVFAHREN